MSMQCSLNEVQTLSYKAARGAGLPWGVAQEAGSAARWLESRRVSGLSALALSLEALDGREVEAFQPVVAAGFWQSRGSRLSGLLAGIALADRCGADTVTLNAVVAPVLLVPFAAAIASVRQVTFSLDVETDPPFALRVNGDSVSAEARALADLAEARAVTLTAGTPTSGPSKPLTAACKPVDGNVAIDDDVWRILDGFARRTYVPESDESRARGAGAGENDAD